MTIINKTKSISLLFSGDEGEQLNDWKNALRQILNGGRAFFREKLNHEGQTVMLQVGRVNLSLTEDRQQSEPARCKLSWPRDMLYESKVNGRVMTMYLQSPDQPRTINVELECQRGACQNGKILSPEETIEAIRVALFEFVVCYWFTKETVYETLQDCIYKDYGSDYYDLNKLEEIRAYSGREQLRSTMENIYKKFKDVQGHRYTQPNQPSNYNWTQDEQFVVNAGHVIQQIRAHPPTPDTLYLPFKVRIDICLRLYTDSQMGTTGDWTALASQIGAS